MTCETCPHYLFLTPDDVERLGAVAKCAPPVREHPGLWERMDEIDMVTSDHSPSSPDLKQGAFADAWGGIAGCQTDADAAGRRMRARRRSLASRPPAPPSGSACRARAGSSPAPTPISRSST